MQLFGLCDDFLLIPANELRDLLPALAGAGGELVDSKRELGNVFLCPVFASFGGGSCLRALGLLLFLLLLALLLFLGRVSINNEFELLYEGIDRVSLNGNDLLDEAI